jgi:hypothetical protein
MTQNDEKLLRILNDNWRKLEKAMQELEYSIEKCDAIGFRHIYTFDERDAFDAFIKICKKFRYLISKDIQNYHLSHKRRCTFFH